MAYSTRVRISTPLQVVSEPVSINGDERDVRGTLSVEGIRSLKLQLEFISDQLKIIAQSQSQQLDFAIDQLKKIESNNQSINNPPPRQVQESNTTVRNPLNFDFPNFSGGNPKEWIRKCEQFLEFHGFSKEEWLRYAILSLKQEASRWFWSNIGNRWRVLKWEEFVEEFIDQFGFTESEDCDVVEGENQEDDESAVALDKKNLTLETNLMDDYEGTPEVFDEMHDQEVEVVMDGHQVEEGEALKFVQRRLHLLPILLSVYSQNYDATDVLDGIVTALMAQKIDQEQLLGCSRESEVRGGKLLLHGRPPPVRLNVSNGLRCGNKDIRLWVDEDMILIGEKGMTLNGAHKQRIHFARVCYSNSFIYLLDAPFSVVDAHTGAPLFKVCLMSLLSCKTVLYATHQCKFMNTATWLELEKLGRDEEMLLLQHIMRALVLRKLEIAVQDGSRLLHRLGIKRYLQGYIRETAFWHPKGDVKRKLAIVGKKSQCRKTSCGCQMLGKQNLRELFMSETQENEALDIEDLVQLGSKIGTCPYYASRDMVRASDLVVLPYQSIFLRSARESLGLNLMNSVIVIDEAHNLADLLTSMYNSKVAEAGALPP